MSNHFSMGAINKTTNEYEYPKIANKINKYKCPSCDKNVIFRNGKIKQPHFAHYKSNSPCYYYDKPNESQIHKDAKLLMKTLLDNKKCINIYRKCNYCNSNETDSDDSFISYDNTEIEYFLNITIDKYNDTQSNIEYKFNYNDSKKSADVALLQGNELKYIFEICYKNKTKEENRPEPWFEIKAEKLINETNTGKNVNEDGEIEIECIRDYKCVYCKDKEELEKKKELENIEKQRNLQIEKEKQYKIRKENEEYEKKKNDELMKIYKISQIENIVQYKIRKENEAKKKQECKCGILIINLCICENPKYELVAINKELHCQRCNKWKCRCKQ